jgi:hypothetical protein
MFAHFIGRFVSVQIVARHWPDEREAETRLRMSAVIGSL